MKKFILFSIIFSFLLLTCQADELSKFIKKEHFNKLANTSLYVINQKNDKVVFKYDESISMLPASSVKILTVGAAYLVLGNDYRFETSIYQDSDSNIYLKLGGDVLLTQFELNNLISKIKDFKINKIYVDNSIFENNIYPDSWLKEDKWPYQRAITPYIIDNNFVNISINRSSLATKVDVLQDDEYQMPIINELKLGDVQDIKIVRQYGDDSPVINLQGSVSKDENIKLPVFLPEVNFNIKFNKALEKNNIIYEGVIEPKKIPNNAIKVASFGRSLDDVMKLILHDSNNFDAEILLRVVASKYLNEKKVATSDDGIKMLSEIYSNYFSKDDKIVDGSGVSRKNCISAKTLCNIINFLFKETKLDLVMPTAGEGTFKERLLFLSDNLKAKSGTMKNVSTISGKLTTRKNNDIIFTILTYDETKRKSLLKNYENRLIGLMYKNY